MFFGRDGFLGNFLVKFSANHVTVIEGFFGQLPCLFLEEFSATACEQSEYPTQSTNWGHYLEPFGIWKSWGFL